MAVWALLAGIPLFSCRCRVWGLCAGRGRMEWHPRCRTVARNQQSSLDIRVVVIIVVVPSHMLSIRKWKDEERREHTAQITLKGSGRITRGQRRHERIPSPPPQTGRQALTVLMTPFRFGIPMSESDESQQPLRRAHGSACQITGHYYKNVFIHQSTWRLCCRNG